MTLLAGNSTRVFRQQVSGTGSKTAVYLIAGHTTSDTVDLSTTFTSISRAIGFTADAATVGVFTLSGTTVSLNFGTAPPAVWMLVTGAGM